MSSRHFSVAPDPEVIVGICKVDFEPEDPEIAFQTRRLLGNPEVFFLDPEIVFGPQRGTRRSRKDMNVVLGARMLGKNTQALNSSRPQAGYRALGPR
ncbi:hypothetical protein F2Q69_00006638 [Brassica cretica]|uniref:Uncharacterized protein n=1 Tax=Brassica cretica TaxID=69181 RepID=A0A8S9P5I4_BRACR|nr:hypothetical protein F2Q69_00006638 [Brassica cretica]